MVFWSNFKYVLSQLLKVYKQPWTGQSNYHYDDGNYNNDIPTCWGSKLDRPFSTGLCLLLVAWSGKVACWYGPISG